MRSIAQQGIGGRSSIAGKPIASRGRLSANPEPYIFPPSNTAYSFSIPETGYWQFVAWGPGGPSDGSTFGGGGGGYGEVTLYLQKDEVATILVGEGTHASSTTTILIRGITYTAARGGTPAGGAATNFDVNLTGGAGGNNSAGSAGGGTGGGAGGPASLGRAGGGGAPANLPFRGGSGGNSRNGSNSLGGNPGGGGGNAQVTAANGGDGLVLAMLVRT